MLSECSICGKNIIFCEKSEQMDNIPCSDVIVSIEARRRNDKCNRSSILNLGY